MTRESKPCATCGKLMVRRGDEFPHDFRRRRSCSRLCGAKLSPGRGAKPKATKACSVCGATFTPRAKTQLSCSKACALVASRAKRIAGLRFRRLGDRLTDDFAAEARGWVIALAKTQRPYILRTWASEEEARRELAELLKPYPAGHEWRKRLCVLHSSACTEITEVAA